MKKLFNLITGGLIKDIGNIIDKVTTTDEERLQAKQKIQELLEEQRKAVKQGMVNIGEISCCNVSLHLLEKHMLACYFYYRDSAW